MARAGGAPPGLRRGESASGRRAAPGSRTRCISEDQLREARRLYALGLTLRAVAETLLDQTTYANAHSAEVALRFQFKRRGWPLRSRTKARGAPRCRGPTSSPAPPERRGSKRRGEESGGPASSVTCGSRHHNVAAQAYGVVMVALASVLLFIGGVGMIGFAYLAFERQKATRAKLEAAAESLSEAAKSQLTGPADPEQAVYKPEEALSGAADYVRALGELAKALGRLSPPVAALVVATIPFFLIATIVAIDLLS